MNPDLIPAGGGSRTCTEIDGSHLAALARSMLTQGFRTVRIVRMLAAVGPCARIVRAPSTATKSGRASARPRHIGAQATVSGETSRLCFRAPRDVVTLSRAVLCTVRRAIERQTEKLGRG